MMKSQATGERALFVAYSGHLLGRGGVQVCTAEFIAVLEAAGFNLEVIAVEPDRRLPTRVLRRLVGSPYYRPLSAVARDTIRERAPGARYVFLNQLNLAGGLVVNDLAGVPAIGLSHGCEITDLLHLARLRRELPLTLSQLRPHPMLALARTLRDETTARRLLAGVIAIAPFDADCERWMGTPRVCWVPRTILAAPLLRQPVPGRFGIVGTLDHAPNLEGLEAILTEIDQSGAPGLVIRVVGGPERLGHWLAGRHAAVEYLGQLDDAALAVEAASWSGFLHPIFCLPRGCSTKLASAISWGLPVLTTPEGRRGYEWRDGALVEVDNPAAFVAAMLAQIEPAADAEAAANVCRIAASSPKTNEVAEQIAAFLATVPEPYASALNL